MGGLSADLHSHLPPMFQNLSSHTGLLAQIGQVLLYRLHFGF
jgi:hypothetical protein